MVAPLESDVCPPNSRVIRLGYVPLIDCAPIVVAREKGYFEKHGIAVITSQQPGWATIREKLVHGELDAAQCLGPLSLAIHHGIGTIPKDIVVPLVMSANGNGITLSNTIPESAFEEEGGFLDFLKKNYSKEKPLTLASVHPCSSHHSLLLQWLQKNKVLAHPCINVISLPPETMVRNLAHGHIGGFCVGEPWNSVAIQEGIGWCVTSSVELSNGHPEKVLAATQSFAQQYPNDLRALTVALLEACLFCQDPANRSEVISFLSAEPGLHSVQTALPFSLSGRLPSSPTHRERLLPDFHIFYDPQVNAPTSHTASWLRDGIRHSGLLTKGQELKKDSIFRMDLFQEAQNQLYPTKKGQ